MSDRKDDAKIDGDPHRDLAGVLHDVSNALTVLLGWVGEARAPNATADTVEYALTIIEQRARVARDLARHAIGKRGGRIPLGSGSQPRLDEPKPIGSLAADVANTLRLEAGRANVTLIVRGGEEGAKVPGTTDVSQVLTNLVLNAIAFAPKGSAVDVDVTCTDDRCCIIVKDEGAGVAESKRESIFMGESLRPGGAGVGLRHSRDLARAWGGDVELLWDPSVKGTRFKMSWPRVGIPRPPISTPRVQELEGIKVLVVEDDEAVTQLLEAALEARGATVRLARAKGELQAAMKEGPYQAALVDLSPIADDPGGAIAALRAASPNIDLILITGSADGVPEAIDVETVKLVRKPFELHEVFSALSRKA